MSETESQGDRSPKTSIINPPILSTVADRPSMAVVAGPSQEDGARPSHAAIDVDAVPSTNAAAADAPTTIAATNPIEPISISAESILYVFKEMGFSHTPVIKCVQSSKDAEASFDDTVELLDYTLFANPLVQIPTAKDDIRVGVWHHVESDHLVLTASRYPNLEITCAEVTKALKDFGSTLSILLQSQSRRRGRLPKSLYLQQPEPSTLSTHIMVTRRSSKSTSSLPVIND